MAGYDQRAQRLTVYGNGATPRQHFRRRLDAQRVALVVAAAERRRAQVDDHLVPVRLGREGRADAGPELARSPGPYAPPSTVPRSLSATREPDDFSAESVAFSRAPTSSTQNVHTAPVADARSGWRLKRPCRPPDLELPQLRKATDRTFSLADSLLAGKYGVCARWRRVPTARSTVTTSNGSNDRVVRVSP